MKVVSALQWLASPFNFLPTKSVQLQIWCSWSSNLLVGFVKVNNFLNFLFPTQPLSKPANWLQLIPESVSRPSQGYHENLQSFVSLFPINIFKNQKKKDCKTNFFFSLPQGGGQREGGGEFGARWKPTKPFDHHSNQQMAKRIQLMNELVFFLRKPPKHFNENHDYHSYQQMAKGTQMMNETPFLDETQKHLFANINKTSWSPEVLRYTILLLITVQFRLTFWKVGQVLGLWALYH